MNFEAVQLNILLEYIFFQYNFLVLFKCFNSKYFNIFKWLNKKEKINNTTKIESLVTSIKNN